MAEAPAAADDGQAGEEGDGINLRKGLIVFVAHVVGLLILWFLFRTGKCLRRWLCCCCGRRDEEVKRRPDEVTLQEMQPRKQLSIAYGLWFCFGFLGAHHFYLERVGHGIAALWSLNFLGFGWLLDGYCLPGYVRRQNGGRCDAKAPSDGFSKYIFFLVPSLLIAVVMTPICGIVFLPQALHLAGYVDIDRITAQTEVNPYELLGLGRHATLAEAKAAFRSKSKEWHPDKNPDCLNCHEMQAELSKAFDAIKKRQAPLPEDNTWKKRLSNIGADWKVILEAFEARMRES
eukprot:TRINITY_DN123670_c0_g1_i1.p1 TRINITY_DN123670_c0_g1~~TRINITY_DN123670_c0_g1_i1.p1  ORF type:complete len:289 (-),score=62.78 TRINITY_DN123670_c0_g1_i1:79-945(-)